MRATAVIATGVAFGLVTFLLFFTLAWASLTADHDALTGPVRAAFAQKDLRPDAAWLFGDTDIGAHQFNDCLILYQAIDDRASRLERAVSPLSLGSDTKSSCADLQRLVTNAPAGPPHFYHHYLHAHTSLARLLVPALGVRGTRELYKLLISLVLLAGIAFTAIALAQGPRRTENAVWLIVFAVFARGFGLESFGQSLGHGPADLVILGYLLWLSRASAPTPLSRRALIAGSALFGALTIEFEFLTGGLPLGLAVVLGGVPLAWWLDRESPAPAPEAALAYLAAAGATFIAKMALVVAVFGTSPLSETGGQLLFRTGVSHAANRDEPAGWGDFASHVWAGLDSLMPGMQWLAAGFLTIALVAGSWGYTRLRRDGAPALRAYATTVAASNIVLLLWMVVFWQHTTEHAWFMDRILVWPIASGAILFFLALRSQAAVQSFRAPTAG